MPTLLTLSVKNASGLDTNAVHASNAKGITMATLGLLIGVSLIAVENVPSERRTRKEKKEEHASRLT